MLTEGHSRALDGIHCYKLYYKTKWRKSSFSNELFSHSPLILFGPTLAQRDTWKIMVGITLAYAGLVGPKSNQPFAIKSARWAKWHWANVIRQRRANKTLAQRNIVIWVVTYHCLRALGTGLSWSEFEHPRLSVCKANALTNYAAAASTREERVAFFTIWPELPQSSTRRSVPNVKTLINSFD